MKTTLPRVLPSNGRSIYIAGPMTGLPGYNYDSFNAIATNLRAAGWTVYNPTEIGAKYGTPDQINDNQTLMAAVNAAEIHAVEKADAIFLLRGWQSSKGARRELAAAIATGAQIITEDYWWNGTSKRNGDLCRYINLAAEKLENDLRLARERRDRYAGAAKLAEDNLRDAEAEVADLERAIGAAKLYQAKENM